MKVLDAAAPVLRAGKYDIRGIRRQRQIAERLGDLVDPGLEADRGEPGNISSDGTHDTNKKNTAHQHKRSRRDVPCFCRLFHCASSFLIKRRFTHRGILFVSARMPFEAF